MLGLKTTTAANVYLEWAYQRVVPKAALTKCAATELITNSFISLDSTNPGGLSPFFIKIRTDIDHAKLATNTCKQALKERESLDPDDDKVNNLTTDKMFVPTSADQLEIVIQGFYRLLGLLTGRNSIVTEPMEELVDAIETRQVEILNCFRYQPDYRARLLCSLDRGYDIFFRRMAAYDSPA